jgi:hypothetical protein
MKKVIEIETIDKYLESFHNIVSNSIELEYPLEHHIATIYYDTRTILTHVYQITNYFENSMSKN